MAFESVMTLAAGDNSALITATDLAGNVATSTITIQRDSTPPKVVITSPLNGLLTNSPQIQVSGTVDDAEAVLTVGGASVSVVNKAFSVAYVLTDGDNSIQMKAVDKAGNEGVATVAVILDATPPVVTLAAPATATAGTDVQITVNATDNRILTLVDLSADGASLWSASPNAASAGQNVSLRLSPTLTPGSTVTVRARALDASGNSGSATAVITVDKAADGPGWLQGKVLDDSRGLPLEGAQVSVSDAKGVQQNATTTADGAWFFELASGVANIEIVKSGFTTVRRDMAVRPGQRTSVLDSRLTRIDGTVRLVDATGGVVKGGSFTVDVSIPANALSAQADVRLTPVSNQGLIAPLPLGWSPLAAADVRLLDPITAAPLDPHPLTAPATLTLPLPQGLGDAALLAQLARYDSTSRRWLAAAEVALAAKAVSASVQVSQPGQYALLLADPAPLNPPPPAAGQELAAASLSATDFSQTSATGRVVPQAALPSVGIRAAGDLLIIAKPDAATAPALSSGLVVNARVTERFDLIGGDKLQPASTVQDIVLYRTPCATAIAGGATEPPFDSAQGTNVSSVSGAELRTTFPVSPSRDFTIVDLLLGKISIEIMQQDTSGGVMVGVDGARLLQPDGTSLNIPAGALTTNVPVTVATLPEATISTLVGADFRLLRGVDIAITGQTLKNSATLSIPAPAGFDPALPVVVAKKFDVKGGTKLKLVAMGKLSGSIISSDTTIAAGSETIAVQGITASGQYLFLQAVAPIGYVTGQVTDAGAAPFAGIQVSAQSSTLADLTGVNGQYLLALAVGSQSVTALDPARGDAASGGVAIAANTRSTLNLTVRMVPPTVTAITPTNGATNVQPTVPVTVTFSKPMDKATITSTTLVVRDAANNPVSGMLTFNVDNTAVTFYPSDAFKQETKYTVTVVSMVKDMQNYPLGQDVVSNFTVRKTTPPVLPPAGAISGTFPDADGYITVTGTQGSAEAGNTVLLINDTTGEIQSVTPATNGSFTGKVRGQMGDEIKVVLMDHSGNQTTISYLTFKGPDGSYLVTAKGGKVEGEVGSILDIPDGALIGPTVLKIKPLLETVLSHPVPEGAKFLGAVNIDSSGFNFQKEVHLSIPLPTDMPVGAVPFLAQPTTLTNADGTVEQVYEIIDSTKVVNGRLTTASPPFDGVMGFGDFVFLYVTGPIIGDVIVSGTAYRDMDGLPGYDPVTDKPVAGAVIRSPQSANFVSYSKADGHYATFGFAANGACRNFPITAIHPMTMFKSTANITTCDTPYFVNNLNFKLADKDTVLPDNTAPVISLGAQVAPGQASDARIIAGTVQAGTEISIPVSILDQQMGSATMTVTFTDPTSNETNSVLLSQSGLPTLFTPVTGAKPAIWRYSFVTTFQSPIAASNPINFRPGRVGLYSFVVEATDNAGNKSRQSLQLRVVSADTSLGESKDGPPTVDSLTPSNGAKDVMVSIPITAVFSEPVTNVTSDTFKLIDLTAGRAPGVTAEIIVPATITTGIVNGRMQAVLTPKGNLYYDREYQVV